jgi:thiol-disulfide isomerase/thioredoxin
MRLNASGAGIAARMLLTLTLAAFVGSTGHVRAAADVVFTDLDGKVHRIGDYRGKWVIVNYWATWCPPCLEEIPELVQFHEEHKDTDAVVLGVNSEDITPERLREFVDSFLVTYPVIPAEPSASSPFGPLPGLPITFLVSPEGEVVARQIGGVTREAIERFIESWNMENR